MPRFRRPRTFAPWLFALATGCSICGTESDQGQLVFGLGLNVDPVSELQSGGAVLEGTRICLDEVSSAVTSSTPTDVDTWWSECIELSAEGPQSVDSDGCFVFDAGPGEVTIHMIEQACTAEERPYSAGNFDDDSLRVEVVEAESVEARLDPGAIERYLEANTDPGPAGEWPADWIPDIGEPLQVIAGEIIALPVTLWHGPASDKIVGWDKSDAVLSIDSGDGPQAYSAEWAPSSLQMMVAANESALVSLDRQGHHWEAGALEGVDVSAAASIELVAAYTTLSDGELASLEGGAPQWGVPFGVRALVRDDQHRLLRAVPVAWRLVDGAMVLSDLDARLMGAEADADGDPEALAAGQNEAYQLPAEYLQLDPESCFAPEPEPVVRQATIQASINGHEASLDLEWSELARNVDEEPFEVPEECIIESEGCGCRANAGAPGVLLIGLVALGFRRRRRRLV